MPKEGSASSHSPDPTWSHLEGQGPRGTCPGQDRALGPFWQCELSPGCRGRAVLGGLVGLEGTGLTEVGDGAEPNAASCHSGCSSSSFYFFFY